MTAADARCEDCGGRVGTIVRGRAYCYPCATAVQLAEAEHAEREARYSPGAAEVAPEPTREQLAELRAQVRAEAEGRPWPLPRGVLTAEART